MLPAEAVRQVKFVDKQSIREYVHENQLLLHQGGTDTFKYVYDRNEFFIETKKKIESKKQSKVTFNNSVINQKQQKENVIIITSITNLIKILLILN